ncbi:SIMPL domain-containing protein [Vibrio sp. CK2-1]|uniref:SIMPL domain-containing protein n=1 Tax=Vibrio sp. CK2-1 TaxID=2912249 RepID=UPI001F4519EB|nr:SIMPL domain-containing protein [Vibrio sp. CK2-1]MCF7354665.1 SIMPL domain-containing protein [Vibrio sp. CK2-1]
MTNVPSNNKTIPALLLGAFICIGLALLGYQLGSAAIEYKQYERSVNVKGLAEKEVEADVVIWPIQFTLANNDLSALYNEVDKSTEKIKAFLLLKGVSPEAISFSAPAIVDKSAQQWGDNSRAEFRYSANQTVTVYSNKIDIVRNVMAEMSELGKQGIVFSGDSYSSQPEYIFTGLNEIKPSMIEEATKNARIVAEKFAKDSDSQLGKIKRASQGQFTISPRDKNTPYIKKIRVVSTVQYYLSD